jgi:hypothetical protein
MPARISTGSPTWPGLGAGDRQAARGGAGGHIQQLQRLGSVERDQIGQRADAGQ